MQCLLGTGVVAVSLHPGAVRTELTRYMGDSLSTLVPILLKIFYPIFCMLTKSPFEGAQTTIHCAIADDVPEHNGCYFRYLK